MVFGTIVNSAAIIAGGTAGLLIKNGIKKEAMDNIIKVEGIALAVIALNGVISNMFSVGAEGKLSDSGSMLLLLSLVIGTFIGELLKIDERINNFGAKIEEKVGTEGFAKGFVTASLIYCIGSMGIMGSLADGMTGDSSILFVKSVLDCITSIVLASTLGIGVIFSAIPVFIYQGLISVSASFLSGLSIMEGNLISDFSMVGYAIILCIAFNFIVDTKIRTANTIPALLIPILYNVLLLVENL